MSKGKSHYDIHFLTFGINDYLSDNGYAERFGYPYRPGYPQADIAYIKVTAGCVPAVSCADNQVE
jgi:hypothetical protein